MMTGWLDGRPSGSGREAQPDFRRALNNLHALIGQSRATQCGVDVHVTGPCARNDGQRKRLFFFSWSRNNFFLLPLLTLYIRRFSLQFLSAVYRSHSSSIYPTSTLSSLTMGFENGTSRHIANVIQAVQFRAVATLLPSPHRSARLAEYLWSMRKNS